MRRTKKEYDMYSLSETTNLPLFCCEKLFIVYAPNSLVFNNQIFNTVIRRLFSVKTSLNRNFHSKER